MRESDIMATNYVRSTKRDGKIKLTRRNNSKTNAKTRSILYSPTIAGRITRKLIEGHSLNKICQMDRMPALWTVYRWLGEYPEFEEAYRKAKQIQMDVLAEKLMDYPDEYEDVSRGRLKTDNVKWLMSKVAAKKYGEKITVGGDANEPIEIKVTYKRSDKQSVDDIDEE
jgi:hypothetical protein